MKHIRPIGKQVPANAQQLSDYFWNIFYRKIDLLIWIAEVAAKF